MNNGFAQKIERLLSPIVGEFMARMAVKSQCKSLGIMPEDIGPHHLDDLARQIGAAMAFHGHKQEVDRIAETIRNLR